MLQNVPVALDPCDTPGAVSTSVTELALYGMRPSEIKHATTAPTALSVSALPW